MIKLSREELTSIMPDHLSPSQVGTVLGCPLKWAAGKLFKWPTKHTEGRMLGIGICCHNFVKKYVKNKELTKADLLAELNKLQENKAVPATRNEEIAEVFWENYIAKYNFTTDNTEKFIKFFLEDNHTRPIVGYIDHLPPGRIVDLKLKSRVAKDLNGEGTYTMSEFIQQGVYSLATGRAETCLDIIYVPLKKSTPVSFEPVEHIYMDDDLCLVKELVMGALYTMWSGVYMPHREYMFCAPQMCDYWEECHRHFPI